MLNMQNQMTIKKIKFMKTEEQKYGKSPFNPIKINGVAESINFINSLVTNDKKPFLYQRLRLV